MVQDKDDNNALSSTAPIARADQGASKEGSGASQVLGNNKAGKHSNGTASVQNGPGAGILSDEAPVLLTEKDWQGTSDHWRVILEIDGPAPNIIGLDVKGPAIIGHSGSDGGQGPDLDLTSFGAQVNGISRRHAVLIPNPNGLYLIDLGSTNGTWLNETYLQPGQKYRLLKGDKVEMGTLKVIVRVVTALLGPNLPADSTAITRPKP